MKGSIYLINGRTGAGKTTASKELEGILNAFRFSHDELLVDLYGESIDDSMYQRCCERVNRLIWKQVGCLTGLRINVIIEGFGGRKLRDLARQEITKIDAPYHFIYIDCLKEIRLERVRQRNLSLNGEGKFIGEKDFYRMEEIKEEFDDDENCLLIDNSSGCLRDKLLSLFCE